MINKIQKLALPLIATTSLLAPFKIYKNKKIQECFEQCIELPAPKEIPKDTIKIIPVDSILVRAMIQVESGGKEDMVGDKNLRVPSIGVLQIRPIMVKEVNRILKRQKIKKKYSLKDRFDREKSIEMFYIWKDFHHECDTDEVVARCWNGGPRGWKKESTEWYWTKVTREIKKLKG
tara:strand:- start:5378 stop:5905 length:528 start_codon:yes stop_codon:yes gene_type:complete